MGRRSIVRFRIAHNPLPSPAQERGEPVGGVVGYSVRLDTKRSARTRLLFCTTGAAASA